MAQKTFLRDHEQLERRIKLAPGNIQKAEEHLDDLKQDLANSYGELITKQEQDIEELKKKFEDNKREFAKPSPYEAQINELMRRSTELTTLINEETKKNQPGEGEPVPVQAASVKHSSRR